jgi:hypothetical protein
MNVGFTYPYATFGGCERVILERVRILNEVEYVSRVSLHFAQQNTRFISFVKHQMEENPLFAKVVLLTDVESLKNCDLIFNLDSNLPFNHGSVVFESHTPYFENIRKSIDGRSRIIVPSNAHGDSLKRDGFQGDYDVIENEITFDWFVAYQDLTRMLNSFQDDRQYLIIFSRLDELKFFHKKFLFEILSRNDDLLVVQAGKFSRNLTEKGTIFGFPYSVLPRIQFLGEVDFATNDLLFQFFAKRSAKSFHLSLSMRESFNLSAFQAKKVGIPAITPGDGVSKELSPDFIFTDQNAGESAEAYVYPDVNNIVCSPLSYKGIDSGNTFLNFLDRITSFT